MFNIVTKTVRGFGGSAGQKKNLLFVGNIIATFLRTGRTSGMSLSSPLIFYIWIHNRTNLYLWDASISEILHLALRTKYNCICFQTKKLNNFPQTLIKTFPFLDVTITYTWTMKKYGFAVFSVSLSVLIEHSRSLYKFLLRSNQPITGCINNGRSWQEPLKTKVAKHVTLTYHTNLYWSVLAYTPGKFNFCWQHVWGEKQHWIQIDTLRIIHRIIKDYCAILLDTISTFMEKNGQRVH